LCVARDQRDQPSADADRQDWLLSLHALERNEREAARSSHSA
jgi:hypothetical protein